MAEAPAPPTEVIGLMPWHRGLHQIIAAMALTFCAVNTADAQTATRSEDVDWPEKTADMPLATYTELLSGAERQSASESEGIGHYTEAEQARSAASMFAAAGALGRIGGGKTPVGQIYPGAITDQFNRIIDEEQDIRQDKEEDSDPAR